MRGHLRIFRSDDERRAWHAHRHDNIAKFHLLIGDEHAVSPVINADAPPSPPRGRVRFRRVLGGCPRGDVVRRGRRERVVAAADAALDADGAHCTFSVTKGGAPLLKFAAPPRRRRDLDALHGALAAVAAAASSSCRRETASEPPPPPLSARGVVRRRCFLFLALALL